MCIRDSLDLDLFDNTKNGYVPVERKKKKIEAPKLIQSKPISFEQAQTEIKASRIAALRAGVIAIVALLILGSLIYSRVMLTNYQSELADQKAALKTEQSENVRLQMQFNSLMSRIRLKNMLRQSSEWLSVRAIRSDILICRKMITPRLHRRIRTDEYKTGIRHIYDMNGEGGFFIRP